MATLDEIKAAAEAGDLAATYRLGLCYQKGEGVRQSKVARQAGKPDCSFIMNFKQ